MSTNKKVGQRVIASTATYIEFCDNETKPRDVIGKVTKVERDSEKYNKPYIYTIELDQPVRVGRYIYTVLFVKSSQVRTIPKGLRV